MPIISSVYEKIWFTTNGPSEKLFFDFCLFDFSKFQITIFYNGFRRFLGSFTTSQIFLIYTFLKMKLRPWNNQTIKQWNWHRNDFVFLFFLNERNVVVSLLVIHSKCTVVHYANLNSSSIKKPFLNCWPLNMLFLLFWFLILFPLTRLLSKTLFKNYRFLIPNSKILFKMWYITEY